MSSRRAFFKKSLGLTAALVGSKAMGAAVCKVTAAQTSGPFVPKDFPFSPKGDAAPYIQIGDANSDLTVVEDLGTGANPKGQVIILRGQVVDQNCNPVAGANVYLWQADDNGHYNHEGDPNIHSAAELDPNFQYRGIAATDAQGRFQFKTIKPKYYPLDANDPSSPVRTAHLHITVMHPQCETLITQTYFEGEVLEDIDRIRQLNKTDIILAPRGSILSELKDLIVTFRAAPTLGGAVGDVQLSVRRRS